MGLYNLTRIEGWYEDFTDLKNRFNNDYYQDFKSSYLRKCPNQLVSKMYLNLQEKYFKIRELYKKVDTVWSEYIVDLENTDNRLAGQSGSVSASTVSSLLSKMPQLNDTQYSLSNSGGQSKNAVLEIGEKILSTGAVVTTTVYSGLFKLREKFQDGALWLVATVTAPVVSLFNKEAGEKYKEAMMDAIAVDRVAEANKYFYENTKVGKYINEKSYLKYDSEFAKKMQNYSEKGFEIAAATALTVATGGLAAPVSALLVVGTGFAIGAGEKAEENYQQEDRSFYGDAGEIAFAGLIKGIEFYGTGKTGQGIITAAKAVASSGGIKSISTVAKQLFTKSGNKKITMKSLFKKASETLKTALSDVDTHMDSLSAAADNITYSKEEGIKVNWKGFAKKTVKYFIANCCSAFVSNLYAPPKTKADNGIEKFKGTKSTSADDLESLKKEYNELLAKSKEKWFIDAKDAMDNGYAWKLDDIKSADDIAKRMNEIEKALGIDSPKVNVKGIESGSTHKSDLEQLKKEYNELLAKSKENWFIDAKNAMDNGYAWKLDDIKSADDISKRMDEIERILYSDSKNLTSSAYPEAFSRKSLSNMTNYEVHKSLSDMDIVIKNIESKYPGEGVRRLEEYLKTGNINMITSLGGSRNYVAQFEPDFIEYYLKKRYNIDVKVSSSFYDLNQTVRSGTLKSSSNEELYSFFSNNGSSLNETYGADQGGIDKLCDYYLNGTRYSCSEAKEIANSYKERGLPLPKFKKEAAVEEYFTLKNKLVSKGLTSAQASVILSSFDDVGACTYAGKANSIFFKFSDNPELFEKKFGFPMYKIDSNGRKVLNSNELLLDMYMHINDISNGGMLFTKVNDSYVLNCSDKIDVFGRKMLDTEHQVYLSNFGGSNDYALNNYLKSKNLKWDSYNLISNPSGKKLNTSELVDYVNAISSSIEDGKAVQMNIFSSDNNITMHSTNPGSYSSKSTDSWIKEIVNENGKIEKKHSGHAVMITGIKNDGFTVSSWGQEYKILYNDLINGGEFNITIDNVIDPVVS